MRTHHVSAFDADGGYKPQSARAEMLLAARRDREQRQRIVEDEGVAILDSTRAEEIAYDHARAGSERIDLYRRQRRLPRVKRPRWIST
jgi:hypothetical protein